MNTFTHSASSGLMSYGQWQGCTSQKFKGGRKHDNHPYDELDNLLLGKQESQDKMLGPSKRRFDPGMTLGTDESPRPQIRPNPGRNESKIVFSAQNIPRLIKISRSGSSLQQIKTRRIQVEKSRAWELESRNISKLLQKPILAVENSSMKNNLANSNIQFSLAGELFYNLIKMSIQKYLSKLEKSELLSQSEIRNLCRASTSILLQQPNVVEVSGEQFVIGDIHGQYYDLRNLLSNIIPTVGEKSYVFLGDYVDRGYNSVETICLLLCYKCLHPKSIILIRGNHETSSLTKIYGFYDEVLKKYGNPEPWKAIAQVFQYLPLAAVIQDRVLCLHGGLSPNVPFIDSIGLIERVREIPETGPMSDLVWSDPDSHLTTWAVSNRGAGYLFPHQAVKQFKHINGIQTIARAHQLVQEGYIFNFGDESLVTIWSAPNYCYRCGNEASVMKILEDGKHQFIKFSPSSDTPKLNISYEHVLPYFL